MPHARVRSAVQEESGLRPSEQQEGFLQARGSSDEDQEDPLCKHGGTALCGMPDGGRGLRLDDDPGCLPGNVQAHDGQGLGGPRGCQSGRSGGWHRNGADRFCGDDRWGLPCPLGQGVLLQSLRWQGAVHNHERRRVCGSGVCAAGSDALTAVQGARLYRGRPHAASSHDWMDGFVCRRRCREGRRGRRTHGRGRGRVQDDDRLP
mmetsp:Transcript_37516/g.86617  ORF Transcript_37516/g.86617 Transcript_37516/m.86617 type:complete len:205 (+) Transcript_37516:754-1368(+)